MQMESMDSATYRYDGPIQKVIDIVAPKAKEAGFSEETDNAFNGMGPEAKDWQQKMGVGMKLVEHRMFTHPIGDVLTVIRMDISNDDVDMKMLTIQLLSPKKMADFGDMMKKPSSPMSMKNLPGPPKHIQAWVDSWADMGMYLPDKEQIEFLHANLSDVGPELEAAVSHENPDVRQRAAYVVAKIGPDAQNHGKSLFDQLKKEQEQLVQIYLIDALAAIRFKNDEVLEFLEAKYESLNDENIPRTMFSGGKYSEVDQKINLAGALYVLADDDSREKYFDFVTRWLPPPNDDMSQADISGYWERRWMAVNSLESMAGATEAIPLLEAMIKEENAKSWVSVHVPRVLAVLKDQASQ